MPNEQSIFPKVVFAAWRTADVFSILPETADIGETLEALFAGDCAAKSTVTIPTTAPLITPTRLILNTGVVANSPPMP